MYLLAKDPEDLAVISACLQDALVIFSDMSYIPKEHRFAAVCSRFRWEQLDQHERVRCGIHFDGILSTQVRGIDQKDQQRVLELLTIQRYTVLLQVERRCIFMMNYIPLLMS